MIRVFIAYKDRDADLFFINHHTTIEEVKQRFFGPYPVVFQTTKGPKVIQWGSIEKVYIQECEHHRPVGEVVEVKLGERPVESKEEEPMADEEFKEEKHPRDSEGRFIEKPMPVVEEPQTPEEDSPAPISDSSPESIQELITEDKPMVDTKFNERFTSFREKFLDLESKHGSWEDQIIEKMAKREELLKNFAATIEEENTALDVFKSEKVGG
jgi:hypothetical protein